MSGRFLNEYFDLFSFWLKNWVTSTNWTDSTLNISASRKYWIKICANPLMREERSEEFETFSYYFSYISFSFENCVFDFFFHTWLSWVIERRNVPWLDLYFASEYFSFLRGCALITPLVLRRNLEFQKIRFQTCGATRGSLFRNSTFASFGV